MIRIAERCSKLEDLNFIGCPNITSVGRNIFREGISICEEGDDYYEDISDDDDGSEDGDGSDGDDDDVDNYSEDDNDDEDASDDDNDDNDNV
jgi:hypothetical protein